MIGILAVMPDYFDRLALTFLLRLSTSAFTNSLLRSLKVATSSGRRITGAEDTSGGIFADSTYSAIGLVGIVQLLRRIIVHLLAGWLWLSEATSLRVIASENYLAELRASPARRVAR